MNTNTFDWTHRLFVMPRFFSVLLSFSLLSACGMPEDFDESTYAEMTQEIRNGTVKSKRGVIEIGGCTGAMINRNYIVTAAHCLDSRVSGTQGWVQMGNISHFNPDRGKNSLFAPGSARWVYVWIKGTYQGSGDTQSDLALVYYPEGWYETGPADYLHLSLGTCSQIDKNWFYGRGYSGFNGEGSGILRTTGIDIKWCGAHHFFSLEGHAAVCRGDSGGPYIMELGDDDAIVGIHSSSEKPITGTKRCAKNGGKQRALRMNDDKVGWIETKMSKTCTNLWHNGHRYKRCWDFDFKISHPYSGRYIVQGPHAKNGDRVFLWGPIPSGHEDRYDFEFVLRRDNIYFIKHKSTGRYIVQGPHARDGDTVFLWGPIPSGHEYRYEFELIKKKGNTYNIKHRLTGRYIIQFGNASNGDRLMLWQGPPSSLVFEFELTI